MKLLFGFLLLLLTAAVAAAAAGVFLLGTQLSYVPPNASLKTFSATIEVPEPLRAELQGTVSFVAASFYRAASGGFQPYIPGGVGRYPVPPVSVSPDSYFTSWAGQFKALVTKIFQPGAPLQFTIDRELLRALLGGKAKADAWVAFELCVAAPGGDCHAVGMAWRHFDLDAGLIDAEVPVDLGRAVVTKLYPNLTLVGGSPLCASGDLALAGKIVPTKAFLAAPPKAGKLALAAVPEPFGEPVSPAIAPFYASDLTLTAAGASFSFAREPELGNLEKDFSLFVITCPAASTASECAKEKLARFFAAPSSADPKEEVFPLVAKGLRVPSCGDKDLTFYLHKFPAKTGAARDKDLPGEIEEDASYF